MKSAIFVNLRKKITSMTHLNMINISLDLPLFLPFGPPLFYYCPHAHLVCFITSDRRILFLLEPVFWLDQLVDLSTVMQGFFSQCFDLKIQTDFALKM